MIIVKVGEVHVYTILVHLKKLMPANGLKSVILKQ